jgi:hypothetical protein
MGPFTQNKEKLVFQWVISKMKKHRVGGVLKPGQSLWRGLLPKKRRS